MLFDHLAEEQLERQAEAEDRPDMDVEMERFDRESSAETPSERSLLTPADTVSSHTTFGKQYLPDSVMVSPLNPLKTYFENQREMDGDQTAVPPSPLPVLQASLVALSDFTYDRFSTIVDSPPQGIMSPDVDDHELISPIETATPISYRQPKARPSLISISSVSQKNQRRTPSIPSPFSQPETPSSLSDRPPKRSSSKQHLGDLAWEATPSNVPDPQANATQRAANRSQESLTTSTKEEEYRKRLGRTSGVPLLSATVKMSPSRMSSIRSFARSPTYASSSSLSRPSSRQGRPMTAVAAAMEEFPSSAMAHYNLGPETLSNIQRSPSAMSTPTQDSRRPSMTALPSLPTPPADESSHDPMAHTKHSMHRKKSFSALRRRSESIGHAIKSVKSMGRIASNHDVPIPTAPVLMISSPKMSLDITNFPTPPSASPRPRKSMGGLSSIGPAGNSSGPIGLGLRSVEGLAQR